MSLTLYVKCCGNNQAIVYFGNTCCGQCLLKYFPSNWIQVNTWISLNGIDEIRYMCDSSTAFFDEKYSFC